MCKLLIVLGSSKPDKMRDFLKAAKEPMSLGNTNGLGYTAIRKDGTIFTERWHNNDNAFKGNPITDDIKKTVKQLGLLVDLKVPTEKSYSLQGKINWGNTPSIILHTRYATCDKSFANTHPFVDNQNEISIAHNGVISNHEDFKKLNSTCDSEIFLTEYRNKKINTNPSNITKLVDELSGYWAVAATSLNKNKDRVIDLFTSNTGHGSGALVVTYVKQLEAYVFCSNEYTLKNILEKAEFKHKNGIYNINKHIFTRFNAVTGKIMTTIPYKDSVESYEVSKNYGQSKTHSSGKTATEKRRSLSSDTHSSTCAYDNKGQHSTKSVGDTAINGTGNVVDFYNRSLDVDDTKYEYDKIMGQWLKNGDSEASDSRYNVENIKDEMSDKEIKELELFASTIDKQDKALIDGLPDDIKFSYLKEIKKEVQGNN